MEDQNVFIDLHQKINLYCDRALTKEDEIELMKKVNENPKIEAMLVEEKAFRTKIKDSIGKTLAPEKLVSAVRKQLDII